MPADDDEICFDEGICVVVGIELQVASACFIDGDASGPPDKVDFLLLRSCPGFCGAADGMGKGSTMERGRTSEWSEFVFERNLRTLFRRDLQNQIKPTTKTTSTKNPTTPPMMGPIMTFDLLLALLGLVELDIADVVAGGEAPVVAVVPVGTALNVTPFKKKGKESGMVSVKGWDVRRRGRAAHQHLEPR